MTRRRLVLCAAASLLSVVTAACGDPPSKEIGEAGGAIAAARAAGAEQYAATEFAAATAALAEANEAVAARDYRLALNHALESREQGEAAARTAAETRARLRGDTERALAQVSLLLSQAKERLSAAAAGRGPRRPRLADVSKALGLLEADLQRVGTAIKSEDYAAARSQLDGLEERLKTVMASLDATSPSQSSRRRR
jgi:hypothetical protein